MAVPLTRLELREELDAYLQSAFKQVFEEVLRSELKQAINQHQDTRGSDPNGQTMAKVFSDDSPSRRCVSWQSEGTMRTIDSARPIDFRADGYEAASSIDMEETVSERNAAALKRRMHRSEDIEEIEALIEHDAEVHQDFFHEHLQTVSGFMVLLNAVCIGLETNHRLQVSGALPTYLIVVDFLFCVFFVIEIALRLQGQCCHFFCGEDKWWNWFDFLVVALQVVDVISTYFSVAEGSWSSLRLLRLFRIIRMVRVLHLFEELHFIVSSLTKTLSVVFWFCVLLLLLVYLFTVLLLELLLETHEETLQQHDGKLQPDQLRYWFGSVPRTIITMFESIAGGVSWDECLNLLFENTSPYACIVFIIYIVVTMLAVLNMLTGLFVDRSTRIVQEERDMHIAAKIHNALFKNNSQAREIDLLTFREVVRDDAMLDYMEELGLNSNECDDLFHLLDDDNSGSLTSGEIVDGCLRLRGQASALNLALVMRELKMVKALLCCFVDEAPRANTKFCL